MNPTIWSSKPSHPGCWRGCYLSCHPSLSTYSWPSVVRGTTAQPRRPAGTDQSGAGTWSSPARWWWGRERATRTGSRWTGPGTQSLSTGESSQLGVEGNRNLCFVKLLTAILSILNWHGHNFNNTVSIVDLQTCYESLQTLSDKIKVVVKRQHRMKLVTYNIRRYIYTWVTCMLTNINLCT